MSPQRRLHLVTVAVALSALPWAACNLILPERSEGERLWARNCADCHGMDGAGNTPRYMGRPNADLRDDDWVYGGDDGSIEQVVIDGIFGEMPAFPDLTSDERQAIVRHLRVLRGELREE